MTSVHRDDERVIQVIVRLRLTPYTYSCILTHRIRAVWVLSGCHVHSIDGFNLFNRLVPQPYEFEYLLERSALDRTAPPPLSRPPPSTLANCGSAALPASNAPPRACVPLRLPPPRRADRAIAAPVGAGGAQRGVGGSARRRRKRRRAGLAGADDAAERRRSQHRGQPRPRDARQRGPRVSAHRQHLVRLARVEIHGPAPPID